MKILFDHPSPFLLAEGGVQVQIEQTKLALEQLGVEVEYARWWDARQQADLIHFFGAPSAGYLRLARQKGLPVVQTCIFSSTCNRSTSRLTLQGIAVRSLLALPAGRTVKEQLQWQSYRQASHIIVGLHAEAKVLKVVYGVPTSRITVLPLGLTAPFLDSPAARLPKDYLITVGTICEVKRSVELAQLARSARTPLSFVGDPFSPSSAYWKEFQTLIDDEFVLHRPHVSGDAKVATLLRSARGFVLMSDYENWSLAAHEAAACGLPLLLPQMKWSQECFGDQAHYFSGKARSSHEETLRSFYLKAPTLASPVIKNDSWIDVADRLQRLYRKLIG